MPLAIAHKLLPLFSSAAAQKKQKRPPPPTQKVGGKKSREGGGDVRGQQPIQGQVIPPFYVGVIGLKKALFYPSHPLRRSRR